MACSTKRERPCCNRRFHEDEKDAGDKLEMQFLKPKPTITTVQEDTPTHVTDMSFVDIIARPIVVVPMCGE